MSLVDANNRLLGKPFLEALRKSNLSEYSTGPAKNTLQVRNISNLSIIRRGVRDFWTNDRRSVLVVVSIGWALSMGTRMVYPVLLPHFRTAYGLDLTSTGFLLTVLFVAYAVCQLPGGVLADQFGEQRILFASMLLAAGMLALVITAGSVGVLFAATALFGGGIALYAVARYTVLTQLYPNQLGTANGMMAAAADASQSALPPLAALVAAVFTWQVGFGFLIPLFLLSGIVIWHIVPANPNRNTNEGFSITNCRIVLKLIQRPSIVYGTAIYALALCVWQAFTGFYPTYLIEIKGLSTTIASIMFGLFFALGIGIKPTVGSAYDRIGARRSLIVVGLIAGIGLAMLPITEGRWPLVIVTVLISALLGVSTIVEAFLLTAIPDDIRGTGFGIVRTITFLVGSISPVAFGAASDRGHFDIAFLVLAGIAVLIVLVSTCISEE